MLLRMQKSLCAEATVCQRERARRRKPRGWQVVEGPPGCASRCPLTPQHLPLPRIRLPLRLPRRRREHDFASKLRPPWTGQVTGAATPLAPIVTVSQLPLRTTRSSAQRQAATLLGSRPRRRCQMAKASALDDEESQRVAWMRAPCRRWATAREPHTQQRPYPRPPARYQGPCRRCCRSGPPHPPLLCQRQSRSTARDAVP
mmetsp:Transcript_3995/g.12761  ORF Transcript_3995/g.12761 Transcript_3995/m.12761 type:complete len:201 (-) Transcript_3995:1780-2382(-)